MQDACRAVFGSGATGKDLQDAIHASFPEGECEECSISEHSHGPVADDEILTKLIVDPIHIDKGVVSPAAFTDAYSLDLSLFREELATDKEIQLAIDQIKNTGWGKESPQSRSIVAVMHASAESIRALRLDNPSGPMCRIYDTGEADKPAHASVFTPTRARTNKSDQRAIRRALLNAFGTAKAMPNYRSGLKP